MSFISYIASAITQAIAVIGNKIGSRLGLTRCPICGKFRKLTHVLHHLSVGKRGTSWEQPVCARCWIRF